VLLAAYLAAAGAARTWVQVGLVILGSLLGQGLIFGSPWYAGDEEMRVVIYGLLLVGMGAFGTLGVLPGARRRVLFVLGGMGLYAEEIDVFFRPPSTMLGLTYAVLGVSAASALRGRWRTTYAVGLMALSYALVFAQEPLALVGTPYIIIAAYAVRSLPASVRAGVAALQQIDPAIEEASANLGADTGYTFRRIMLPLILPAFIAGLIFSCARHITSLSAIIFLTNPRWRILTALILSEVEQGGMSVAAAYSVLLIAVVFGAMGVMYAVTGRTFSEEERTDVALAVG
jgi:ABC-type molybdate transport system permease subunit